MPGIQIVELGLDVVELGVEIRVVQTDFRVGLDTGHRLVKLLLDFLPETVCLRVDLHVGTGDLESVSHPGVTSRRS